MGGTSPEPARSQDNMEGCDLKLTAAKIILYYLLATRFHEMKSPSINPPATDGAARAMTTPPCLNLGFDNHRLQNRNVHSRRRFRNPLGARAGRSLRGRSRIWRLWVFDHPSGVWVRTVQGFVFLTSIIFEMDADQPRRRRELCANLRSFKRFCDIRTSEQGGARR